MEVLCAVTVVVGILARPVVNAVVDNILIKKMNKTVVRDEHINNKYTVQLTKRNLVS